MSYARTTSGRRIYVDDDDPRGRKLLETDGNFNPASMLVWQLALDLRQWDLVVDVGANYGEMLVGAELPASARLMAFEPNTKLHPFLARTLDEAGLTVDLRSDAVAERAGSARFAVDSEWSGTSSLYTGQQAESDRWDVLEVPTTTLDEAVDRGFEAVCVKIDVEGFEAEVVAGAARLLAETTCWALMLEVHHMHRPQLAALAERHAVFLMDTVTQELIQVPGGNAGVADRLLASRWLHFQDCLVLSPEVARSVTELRTGRGTRV